MHLKQLLLFGVLFLWTELTSSQFFGTGFGTSIFTISGAGLAVGAAAAATAAAGVLALALAASHQKRKKHKKNQYSHEPYGYYEPQYEGYGIDSYSYDQSDSYSYDQSDSYSSYDSYHEPHQESYLEPYLESYHEPYQDPYTESYSVAYKQLPKSFRMARKPFSKKPFHFSNYLKRNQRSTPSSGVFAKIASADQFGCALRLVCHLHQIPWNQLTPKEMQVCDFVGTTRHPGKVVAAPRGSYQAAAFLGQRGHNCTHLYESCPLPYQELQQKLNSVQL